MNDDDAVLTPDPVLIEKKHDDLTRSLPIGPHRLPSTGDSHESHLRSENRKAGDLVSLEILDASRRVTETKRLEFQLAD